MQINENQKEPRVVVESEDQPERVLLETRICKEDGFHKQQGMSDISPQSHFGPSLTTDPRTYRDPDRLDRAKQWR